MSDFRSDDLMEEKRARQMAILKASNQMLREAKETAMSKVTDKVRQEELKKQFDLAFSDNASMARTYLNATPEEIEKSEYRDVEQKYVREYKERLKKRGLTDEEMHQKSAATVTAGKNKKANTISRRPRKGKKKIMDDDYQPLENEEELMKMTLVTDEKQIERQIKKNEEYMQQKAKRENDKLSVITDALEDKAIKGKIAVSDFETVERVNIDNKDKGIIGNKDTGEGLKNAEVQQKGTKKPQKTEVLTYDFDFSGIPSYVQYDVIPLPSKGECYPKNSPLRCGRIPVAYLTASDENVIVSPNMYRDGKLLDVILSRKILDKRINVNDIVSGDRDAIILWLRATSYGEKFPVSVRNPQNGKQYSITINLSEFDYIDFDLEGDEDGLFDFTTDKGDLLKFKFFTAKDDEELRSKITSQITNSNKIDILKSIKSINEALQRVEIEDEEKAMIEEDMNEINEIIGTDLIDANEEIIPNTVTEQMIMHTVSVNGNDNKEYIKNYIENMRSKDAMDYRNYFINNTPGVDFNFTVNIPESDGGGSFTTFLRIEDTIFINF